MKVIQHRKIWIGISLLIIIVGFAVMIFNSVNGNGAFNYDIQFKGGTSIEVSFNEDFDQAELEELVQSAIIDDDVPVIQKVTSENKAIIKLRSVIDDITVDEALGSDDAAAVGDETVADEENTAAEEDAADTAAEEDKADMADEENDGVEVESIISGDEADVETPAVDGEADNGDDAAADENADNGDDAAADENAVDGDDAAADDGADPAADGENVVNASLVDNGDGTYGIVPVDENGNPEEVSGAEDAEESEEAVSEATTEHVFTVATGEGYSGNIAAVIAAVAEKYQLEESSFSVTQISATISSEMTQDAILAVFLACIMMLIYVSIRFKDFKTGASSIIALIHDSLIVLTCYAVLRIPLSSTFIAAILTVLGYSINASIVIFDRVRENKNAHRKWTTEQLVDESVRECMRRSLFTSLTTLLTIGALYIFGVQSIKEFALPIVVGIVAGTWSSVLIAGSVWYEFSKMKIKKK